MTGYLRTAVLMAAMTALFLGLGALLGGMGGALIALVIVVLIPRGGISIGEPFVLTWILAPVIVWLVTALATWLLPMVFIKKKVEERRSEK